MRKMIIIILILLIALISVVPVFADNQGPCNDSPDPGNSSYAKHHIVALAKIGGLGNDGHKPGGHQGYSLCLGVH